MANGVIKENLFMPFNHNAEYSNVDLNDFTNTGIFRLSGGLTHNAGGNNYGFLEVYRLSGSFITQIFYGTGDNRIFKRLYSNGTWGNWFAFTGTELT